MINRKKYFIPILHDKRACVPRIKNSYRVQQESIHHSIVKSETYSMNVYELCMLYDAQLRKETCLCMSVELIFEVEKNGIQVDGEMAYSKIRKGSKGSLMPFLEQWVMHSSGCLLDRTHSVHTSFAIHFALQDELKKLYAQLEIYKRKKMIANNPHLQKKRCSKKGLGRSIMRRITEIPETVTRQCSRDEKDLMEHSAVKNMATLRKNPQDSMSSAKPKEETLKNRVFSLKKSHSTYDHVRDQTEEPNSLTTESTEVIATENSLLDSLNGNKLTKNAPEKVEAVSTESVPLVCKSVSAHNLSADKKPLHPRTSVLQKSLSVIASAKEKTLGLTGKTQSLEESTKSHKSQQKGKEASKKHSASDKGEHKDSHRKNSTHSEETKKTHKSGIMKQQRVNQTPANPDTGPGKSLHKDNFNIGEVCPWEIYDQTPGPVPSDSKVQKHVSIASSEPEKNHPSQPKAKTHHKLKTPEGYQQSNQKSPEKVEAPARETQEQQVFENEKKQSNSKSQVSPGLKCENVNRYTPNTCAGEREELPQKAPENENLNKLAEQKKNASSEGNVLSSDSHKPSSYLQQPLASRAEVCPWEYDTPDLPNAERSVALSNTSAISANKTATPRK